MLARGGLLRNADPHLRGGNVPDLRRRRRPTPVGHVRHSGWLDDRQPDADLHQARRCRGDRSRRHEPCLQAPPARGGVRHGGRAERRDRRRAAPTGPAGERSPSGCGASRTTCSTWAPTCRCPPADEGPGTRTRLRVDDCRYTAWLEGACDEVNATLEPLHSFVIPGGTPAAAHLHVCRTVCRRAERRAIAVEDGNPEVVRYLNRLSDLLFILARAANVPADGLRAAVGPRGPRRLGDRRAARPPLAGLPAALVGPPQARLSQRSPAERASGARPVARPRPAPPTSSPSGSPRRRRWACAWRGSAGRPATAGEQDADHGRPRARRREAASTAQSASVRAAVACPEGHEETPNWVPR